MEEIQFPVKLQLRLDWSELDYFGHVNNVSFFKYIRLQEFISGIKLV
jgi:acyl-CoA thioester hydrolase